GKIFESAALSEHVAIDDVERPGNIEGKLLPALERLRKRYPHHGIIDGIPKRFPRCLCDRLDVEARLEIGNGSSKALCRSRVDDLSRGCTTQGVLIGQDVLIELKPQVI